jgi:hypothetical protein
MSADSLCYLLLVFQVRRPNLGQFFLERHDKAPGRAVGFGSITEARLIAREVDLSVGGLAIFSKFSASSLM